MANKEKGSLLYRVTRGKLGKAPAVERTQRQQVDSQPRVQSLTLQPPTREEGISLQRRHGMKPIYEFNAPEAGSQAVAKRESPRANLHSAEGVAMYMAGSGTRQEWDKRADQVKAANGGNYPSDWYQAVVLSGLMSQVSSRWEK